MIFKWIGVAATIIAICLVVMATRFLAAGMSTHRQPGAIETLVARRLRLLSIPSADRGRANAVTGTRVDIADATSHWADHCAVCHAADGSGDTAIGRNLFPPAPDMRGDATQSLSDGEIFYIIRNGVRFTGMPGWSTKPPQGDDSSWQLVHFIRELPALSDGEVHRIKGLMPKSEHEMEEERLVLDFLSGGNAGTAGRPSEQASDYP